MAASPHDTQLPLRPQIKEGGTIEIFGSSSTPSIFPAELLLSIARYTEDTEDLQTFDFPRARLGIDMHYGMKLQNLKDIMSDYNERFTDSRPTDNDSTFRTVVDSGEFERVLGEGLQRLPELRSLFICSDALCSPGGKRGGDKFDAIQHLTVADYVKHKILHYLYRSSIGRASPLEIMGALSQWPVSPEGKDRAPSSSPQKLVARLDTSGEVHHELSQGRRGLILLQFASNLKSLRLRDVSDWSAGFDNLLHLIFKTATWPILTEISIHRDRNVGLLPFAPRLIDYSLGWYLFLQRDLDRFLIRQKSTLGKLIAAKQIRSYRACTTGAY
ncbi:hypothetical protein Q7P36_011176 [Cladosporium allicinum]